MHENFDIADISEFPCHENTPDIKGINVTIPYKEVIAHLFFIKKATHRRGKHYKITKKKEIKGYNTDYYFKNHYNHFSTNHQRALILGTGGF
jgi:shikimate dehydrogenase